MGMGLDFPRPNFDVAEFLLFSRALLAALVSCYVAMLPLCLASVLHLLRGPSRLTETQNSAVQHIP